MPREGPGDRRSTLRALAMLPGLPPEPLVLDLGCGPGTATPLLAERTGGRVVGLDLHGPFLQDLREAARGECLSSRVHAVRARMEALPFASRTFDLIWSEGALYSAGFARGLERCREALKPGGHLGVTEAVWLEDEPPEEVRRFWEKEYPALATVAENLALVEGRGFTLLGHFTLPESAWWEYYRPIETRLAALRPKYAADSLAQEVLAEAEAEMEMYRRHSRFYGYEFFVARSH